MSVQTKIAKVLRLLSQGSARLLGVSPRVTYLHYWTLREDADSLICLHNFFSILAPETRQPCRAFIRFYDATGRHLASTSLDLEPKGSRMVGVRRTLGHLVQSLGRSAEGSLEVDMVPPADFRSALDEAESLQPSNAYFYVIYRSPGGMLATVHSIDRGPTFRGVPAPVGRMLGVRTRAPARSWRSKRPICADGLREVRAVEINHAGGSRRLHLALRRGSDGPVVSEVSEKIPSRGLLVLEYRVPGRVGSGGGERGGHFVLSSEALATPNAKPYVWVGYGTGPMTMHHG